MPTRRHPEQAAGWRNGMQKLSGACAWFFLIFTPDEEFSDLHEVVGQNGDADKHAESFLAVSKTTFHASAAEEHGNAAFDAGAEALRLFEIRTFLKGGARGSFLSAALGNTSAADTSFAADLLVIGVIEAPVGGKHFRD